MENFAMFERNYNIRSVTDIPYIYIYIHIYHNNNNISRAQLLLYTGHYFAHSCTVYVRLIPMNRGANLVSCHLHLGQS